MNRSHTPVLADEILKIFQEISDLNTYFDGTFGRGGHYQILKEWKPEISALVFDQDLEAIRYAHSEFNSDIEQGKLQVLHKSFFEFDPKVDGYFDSALLDLGVSSPQLDTASRGFSFYHEGPLDMRMNELATASAKDLIHDLTEEDLIQIFREYGEIQKPERVVRAIIHDRKTILFETTRQLASLIERVDGWKKKGFHPATQYFQALRIAVNNELAPLKKALENIISGLKPQGRLCVLTFHSLEDRIVKRAFLDFKDLGVPLSKKVIVPSEEEQKMNPRSRSAKLRVFVRDGKSEPTRREKFLQRVKASR